MSAALLAGVLSLPHCAAMCGPLAMASCGSARRPLRRGARYLLGRLVGYGTAGALLGALGYRWVSASSLGSFRAATMALLLLWCGYRAVLAIERQLAPRHSRLAAAGGGLVTLGRSSGRSSGGTKSSGRGIGAGKFFRTLSGLLALRPQSAFGMGLLTAVLPCSALVAAWLLAAATADPVLGSASMLAFAMASSPALMLAMAGHRLIRGWLRRLPPLAGAVGWLALGGLLAVRWWMSSTGPSCH